MPCYCAPAEQRDERLCQPLAASLLNGRFCWLSDREDVYGGWIFESDREEPGFSPPPPNYPIPGPECLRQWQAVTRG